jgi:hypothetical protein
MTRQKITFRLSLTHSAPRTRLLDARPTPLAGAVRGAARVEVRNEAREASVERSRHLRAL